MSTIKFVCENEQKEQLKKFVWEQIRLHYYLNVAPNSQVTYENKGKEVYLSLLDKLMESELCQVSDQPYGILFELETTEDAGYAIAESVYGTLMGYNDSGLGSLNDLFEKTAEAFPDVFFEADIEIFNKWCEGEVHALYDGEKLTIEEDL